jgi:hypothetical protein
MEAAGALIFFGYFGYWISSAIMVGRITHKLKGVLRTVVVTSLLGVVAAISLNLSMLPLQYPLLATLATLLAWYGILAPGIVIGTAWWIRRYPQNGASGGGIGV